MDGDIVLALRIVIPSITERDNQWGLIHYWVIANGRTID
jgi:hypothetical protein